MPEALAPHDLPAPPQAVTLEEFVQRAELIEIGCYELFGARGAVDDDGDRAIVGFPKVAEDEEFDVSNSLGVYWAVDGGSFLIRFSCVVSGSMGDLRAGVQGEYVADGLDRESVPPEVEEAYVNKVAVMTLAPYLREAVADISRRVFSQPFTLGVLHAGELAFQSPRRSEPEPD